MKRGLGYVSLLVGATLVFLVPLLLLYSIPRIEKAPTDTDQNIVSDGTAVYFSAQRLQLIGPYPVRNIEIYKGDPGRSSATVAVVHYTSHLLNLATRASVSWDRETYAMNRKSGGASDCCGERPKMSGVTLKFPFGTKKTTYSLWDPSANKSFPVRYVRTQDLDGVSAYVFQGASPAVSIGAIDLPNSLVGVKGQGLTTEQSMYQAGTTVWIEPVTGEVLKGEKLIRQWAQDSSGALVLRLANVHVAYSDATVKSLASDAKTSVEQLTLLKLYVPLVGGIVGAILAILGLWVLLRRPPVREWEREPAEAAA